MTTKKITNILQECVNDITFVYKGKQSGITVTVENYKPLYQMWYGDKSKDYENITDVMKDKFFNGKSLTELIDIVEFSIL